MSTYFSTYRKERAKEEATFIIENGATLQATAKAFEVSKSTVHKDVTNILPTVDTRLATQVQAVLAQNKNENFIRGGMATKEKYAKLRNK